MTGDPDRPWSEDTSDEFGQEATKSTFYEPERTRIKFWGKCPACRHDFVYFWPLEIIARRSLDGAVVMCRCAHAHSGRPAEVKNGCGAYWKSGVQA